MSTGRCSWLFKGNRCPACKVPEAQIGPRGQHGLHDAYVAVARGPHQGGEALHVRGLHLGPTWKDAGHVVPTDL